MPRTLYAICQFGSMNVLKKARSFSFIPKIGLIKEGSVIKKLLALVIVILVVAGVGTSLYLSNFLYDPFTFQQDEITPASWNDYKLPMEIRYYVAEGNNSTFVNVTDPNEIRFVFEQLKKGAKAPWIINEDFIYDKVGRALLIEVRSGANVYLLAMGWEGSGVNVMNNVHVEFTSEIKDLITQRLNEAEEI